MFFPALHQLVHGEGDFIRMGCAPGDDSLEFDEVVCDGANFHQFGFDDFRIAHRL